MGDSTLDHELQESRRGAQNVCDLVAKDPELEWNKRGRGLHFGASRIPVYGMAADHSEFLVTYYTPEDGLCLDQMCGRGTNVLLLYGMVEE